jgi:hypothetical protein
MLPDEVLPFEHHQLKCYPYVARDPEVREEKRNVPFSPGIRPWQC